MRRSWKCGCYLGHGHPFTSARNIAPGTTVNNASKDTPLFPSYICTRLDRISFYDRLIRPEQILLRQRKNGGDFEKELRSGISKRIGTIIQTKTVRSI